MRCEILYQPQGMASRGRKMLSAMIEAAPAAGIEPVVSSVWSRNADLLMTYGLGHPQRRQWTQAHLQKGGRVIAWDLGYWDRDKPGAFKMRITIDRDHPWHLIGPESPDRLDRELRDDYSPDGHILLCGLGRKQRNYKGHRTREWEAATLKRIQKSHPGRRILYRPKKQEPALPGCRISQGTIEEAMRGASLVVCSHSNVAIDACIAGIPVECEDGIAFSLYRDNPNPSPVERLEFLRSVAHWQYSTDEAAQAWNFIRTKLSA